MFRLWISDLDSPSYFAASAAVALGSFRNEGIEIELVHDTDKGPELMREGRINLVAGSAFVANRAYPAWKGLKILCALSQYSYWFLAVRADLNVTRGDLEAVKGLRISASKAFPGVGLRHLLDEAGLDLDRDRIKIVPSPPLSNNSERGSSGVEAIRQNLSDAYWGNGMRVALGEDIGIAKVHIDLRRGDGPPGARFYNFPALITTDEFIRQHPDVAAGVVRAIANTQQALKADPSLATRVGEELLPRHEASLIGKLIERDAPFYSSGISQRAVDGLMKLGIRQRLLSEEIAYNDLVAVQFRDLWSAAADV